MADEEPCDIKLDLEKECLAQSCQHKVAAYQECLERIKQVPPDREPHCYHQYFDIIHCVDVCVDPKLWPTLK
uniref:Putative ubiquinol-cytochrome c reductase n=1 Tax=Trypanosoma vivax (strain Y486) TaxID=1055687 RepID=G0TUX9_TRYVY|nr:putative ubiquinol-cytochrome c reductase [Trypanosoma vivax Y486]